MLSAKNIVRHFRKCKHACCKCLRRARAGRSGLYGAAATAPRPAGKNPCALGGDRLAFIGRFCAVLNSRRKFAYVRLRARRRPPRIHRAADVCGNSPNHARPICPICPIGPIRRYAVGRPHTRPCHAVLSRHSAKHDGGSPQGEGGSAISSFIFHHFPGSAGCSAPVRKRPGATPKRTLKRREKW